MNLPTPKEVFAKNKMIYLSQAINKDTCRQLTERMFSLKKEGKLVQDEQCPLSWSVYGDEVFDKILADMAPHLSEQLDIELLPAYTYARIYQNGEELKRHKDRPACEISGTITLGYDEDSMLWPIFMGKDDDPVGEAVLIEVGDLLMYRGTEMDHWRPPYKGKWQVQLFFHYVDKNGPHAEWARDKRNEFFKGTDDRLGYEVNYNGVMLKTTDFDFPGVSCFHSNFNPEYTFSKEECEKIISLADQMYGDKAKIGDKGGSGVYNPNIRAVDNYNIELNDKNRWIFDKVIRAVGKANSEYYKFNLMGINHSIQLLHYKSSEKGHYDWHMDTGSGSNCTRKISISIPLTDRNSYEGGDLEINDVVGTIKAIDEQGSISFFPSFLSHRVSPVTKGERWVMVIWVNGSDRFK
jgi:hypothetical protein